MIDEQELRERQSKVLTALQIETQDVLDNAYFVGSWLWIEFPEKPSDEVIKKLRELGFKWNRKRKVWQNSFGQFSRFSDDDPKQKYPVISLK